MIFHPLCFILRLPLPLRTLWSDYSARIKKKVYFFEATKSTNSTSIILSAMSYLERTNGTFHSTDFYYDPLQWTNFKAKERIPRVNLWTLGITVFFYHACEHLEEKQVQNKSHQTSGERFGNIVENWPPESHRCLSSECLQNWKTDQNQNFCYVVST